MFCQIGPPSFLSFLTKSTLWLERCAPLFIFIYPLRHIGAMLFITFHLGLFFTMRLGLFPFICIAGWIILIPTFVWGGSELSINDLVKIENELPPSSSFLSMAKILIENLILTTIQLFSIYLAVVSNVNTLPKMALKKNSKIFFQNDFIVNFINNYIFEIPIGIYSLARFLGQNQQWFLFDKPQEYSFWYDIVGKVECIEEESKLSQGTSNVFYVDLHTIYQNYVNKTYIFNFSKNSNDESIHSSFIHNPIKNVENIHDQFNWNRIFANNRFRKLYQRLADKKNRYNKFHESFALHMKMIFDVTKEANFVNRSVELREIKFIAYRKTTLPWKDYINASIMDKEKFGSSSNNNNKSAIGSMEMWSFEYKHDIKKAK